MVRGRSRINDKNVLEQKVKGEVMVVVKELFGRMNSEESFNT